jgi:ABC-type phosphate/phosphonate transport system substrate-binding protein
VRIAALGMYDLAEARGHTDALWRGVARHLRALGFDDVPDGLERGRPLDHQWRDPQLLLAQACGFPLTHALAGAVRVVAAPCHDLPGCAQGEYRSLVVVRDRSPAREVADLAGAAVAINEAASHSGRNALLALVAGALDGAGPRPFFGRVLFTGAHVESVAAVARGDADVASIDAITHALLARHRPGALEGTRVLAESAVAPALPYVTRRAADDDEVARLREALARTFADPDPELVRARDALLLRGVRPASEGDYARILELERAHAAERLLP